MKPAVLMISGLLLLAPVGAMAEHGSHGAGTRPGKNPEAMMERHLETLDLEPGQKERLREILASSKESRRENREKVRAALREMRALLEQESPDEAAVMRQAEKMGALKTEGHKAKLRTLLAVRAELTAEQREKLKEMKHSRRKHDEHRGEGETSE